MLFLIAIVAALMVALFVTPLSINLAFKLGVIDRPNARKVHTGAVPRMGGIAIYIAFVAGTLILGFYTRQVAALLVASTLVMAGGLIDDIKGVSPRFKLVIQLIGALILVKYGIYVEFITNPFSGGMISLGIFAIPITIIWLMGVSNAVNLIDGLDGLSAGVSAIAALTMSVVCYAQGQITAAYLAAILAAAAFGFLRYNFHPAKTFMGDCGSLFLGFCLGALSVMGLSKGATVISIFIPLIILGIPIFDTFFAVIRRKFLHKPIFDADKGHLHHCLLSIGLSHRKTVLLIYAISVIMGIAGILMAVLTTSQAVVVLIIISVCTITGADILGVLRGKPAHFLQRSRAE
ncbi:MAG: glycosyltransferase family 4 protein [Bacillota bacterium]|jgi:UDP-GlcNAc:undecaprenyl-phosphate GlcNAc-1-phosphate transferase